MRTPAQFIAERLARQLASVGKLANYTEHSTESSADFTVNLGTADDLLDADLDANTPLFVITNTLPPPVCAVIETTDPVTFGPGAEDMLARNGIIIRAVDNKPRP